MLFLFCFKCLLEEHTLEIDNVIYFFVDEKNSLPCEGLRRLIMKIILFSTRLGLIMVFAAKRERERNDGRKISRVFQ